MRSLERARSFEIGYAIAAEGVVDDVTGKLAVQVEVSLGVQE